MDCKPKPTLIKDLIQYKPSKAIRAMVDGLLMPDEERGFKINMSTFGARTSSGFPTRETCFGCAATCALAKLSGARLGHAMQRGDFLEHLAARWVVGENSPLAGFHPIDIEIFERAMDNARKCELESLFLYCDVLDAVKPSYTDGLMVLTDSSWKERLPAFVRLAERLEADGL